MQTQTDDHKRLQDQVDSIAKDLSEGITLTADEHQHIMDENGQEAGDIMSGFDYLSDVLDIQYIVSSSREYLGARVLVGFGGPNIWINTQTNTVEGYWWGDSAFAGFTDEMGIDDALNELYDC